MTNTRICETNVSLKVHTSLTNCLLCHICPWKTCKSTVTYLLKNSTVVYVVFRVPCTRTPLPLSLVLMERSIHERMVI